MCCGSSTRLPARPPSERSEGGGTSRSAIARRARQACVCPLKILCLSTRRGCLPYRGKERSSLCRMRRKALLSAMRSAKHAASTGWGIRGKGRRKEHPVPPRQAERGSRDGPRQGESRFFRRKILRSRSVRIQVATRVKPEDLERSAVHLLSDCCPSAVCLKIRN